MEISRIRAQHTRLKSVREKLSRLMPFDEWCRAVKPTQSAMETYEFVRSTLESELEHARHACELTRWQTEVQGTPRRSRQHR
jgi:hypothetical protein